MCCAGALEEREAKQAQYAFTLATLQSFTRRYYKSVASLASQVEDMFAGDSVPEDVRSAVLESLHL